MAASSTPELDWIAPWVNWRMVIGVPVPNPTWVSPSPAPSDSVTRSRKQVVLSLNPGVLRLARLLPTTSIAVDMASSAERAVEKDVNISVSCQLVVWVVPVVMDCSSVWNCASWVRNWVLSAGFNGSWFWIWATRSCRNSFLVTSVVLLAAVVLVELLLGVVGTLCAIAGIISFSLGIHGVAADFGGNHLVHRLLCITVVVEPGNQPGVDQPSVGHLDHLIRLVLLEGTQRGNGIHRHHLAAQHLRYLGGCRRSREVVGVIAVAAGGPGSAGVGAESVVCFVRK